MSVKPGPKQQEREYMRAEKEEGGVGVPVKPGPKQKERENMRAEKEEGGRVPVKSGLKHYKQGTQEMQ